MKHNKTSFLIFAGICSFALIACGGQTKSSSTQSSEYRDFSLELAADPTKTVYLAGQSFDRSGTVIKKVYRDGTKEEVDLSRVSFHTDYSTNTENLEAGTDHVTAFVSTEAGDRTIDIDITVKETYSVACVGDSLTAGHFWANEAWPVYINEYAENHTFNITNCGVNGISITGYGGSWDDPSMRYIEQDIYQTSLNCNPDVIVLELGTNDATGWAKAQDLYEEQYRELIDSYIDKLGEQTKFIMLVAPPTKEPDNQYHIPNYEIKEFVNPIQRDLAEEYGMVTIDLREIFESNPNYETEYLRPNNDGAHFTVAAARLVAELVANELENI